MSFFACIHLLSLFSLPLVSLSSLIIPFFSFLFLSFLFLSFFLSLLSQKLLRASTVEHLLSAEICPRFSFLSALETQHRYLTRALNEATVAVSLATASAERQRRQLLASQRLLRDCMQRASAAKRQAVCSRNKWMEVEQVDADCLFFLSVSLVFSPDVKEKIGLVISLHLVLLQNSS